MRNVSLCPLLAAALLAGCDSAESVRIEEARAKLVGTWLEEVAAEDAKSRRVLSLGTDGKFIDRIVLSVPGAPAQRRELAGEWSYDGTNLKRRYLRENGRQFSGSGMRYATFPLRSVTQSELVVDDNIRGKEALWRRVPEGTEP